MENIPNLLNGDNASILQQQLQAIGPSIGIDMPTAPPPTFPASVGTVIDIPSMVSPIQEIQGYDPSMEQGSWGIYTDRVSTRDMRGLNMKPVDSFCECNQQDGIALNAQCGKLTEYNCKRVGCCVYTSTNKCMAGNKNGPSYDNSITDKIDYYYYKNKCYGNKCPSKKSCSS